MTDLTGKLVVVTRATGHGSETILGRITRANHDEIHDETHVDIKGHVTLHTIGGLPLPIEVDDGEEPDVTINGLTLDGRHEHLIKVEIL